MALSSYDETDLFLPLLSGVHETPPFETFLARLRKRTGAMWVGLVIREQRRLGGKHTVYGAGPDLKTQARRLGLDQLLTLEGLPHEQLRLGRVYSLDELIDHYPALRAERAAKLAPLGVVDERVVRVSEHAGHTVSLFMTRSTPCKASDSALLSGLSPYVAEAVASLQRLESQRCSADLAFQGLDWSGMGWIHFDRDARITAIDRLTADRLAQITGSRPHAGERLHGVGHEVERALAHAASEMADNPDAASVALRLTEHPGVELLLVPNRSDPDTAFACPAVTAYCRFPKRVPPDGTARLGELYGLARREAELAIALAQGLSITEAAQALGLTIETTRNYTKRIYSKMGTRGQADLVRLVLESSAMLG